MKYSTPKLTLIFLLRFSASCLSFSRSAIVYYIEVSFMKVV